MIKDRELKRRPFYKVDIGGNMFSPDNSKRVIEVSVDSSDEKATMGRVVFADPLRDFLDKAYIMEDTPVTIEMGFKPEGHPPKMRVMLKGRISIVEVDFGADAVPMMTISVVDGTGKLDEQKKNKSWKKKRKSDVVKEVMKSAGYKVKHVQETKEVLELITQMGESDMQLIERLGKEEGFIVFLDSGGLFWGSREKKQSSQGKLEYSKGGHEIISFRPQYIEKQSEVKVEANNIPKKEVDNKKTDNKVTAKPSKNDNKTGDGVKDSVVGDLNKPKDPNKPPDLVKPLPKPKR